MHSMTFDDASPPTFRRPDDFRRPESNPTAPEQKRGWGRAGSVARSLHIGTNLIIVALVEGDLVSSNREGSRFML
eukprot:539525-Rhodomonas_salina.1